jgi:hypothetical protein
METWIDLKMKWTRDTNPFPHTRITNNDELDDEEVWDRLVNFLSWKYFEDGRWVFRGVRQESYQLKSTLDRAIEKRKGSFIGQKTAEDYLLKQFRRAAHHFLKDSMVPKKDDKL